MDFDVFLFFSVHIFKQARLRVTAPAGVSGVIRRFSWTFQCRTCWLAFLSFSCTSWEKIKKISFSWVVLNILHTELIPNLCLFLTSRRWWLLWQEACRSWSSWEAESRAEGVSSSALPSEASSMGLRLCKALCCSWRSWNCFFFSSSTCSNLERRN